MPKNRSKRLRKKLRVGEFKEFVFWISFVLHENLTQETLNSFTDQFLDAMKDRGLRFSGGIAGNVDGFVRLDKRGSVTEEHKVLVENWLTVNPLVANLQIGEFIDAKEGVRALYPIIDDEEYIYRCGFLIIPDII
jgi:uncharacterized protein YggL (DUF469 family)